MSAGSTTSPEQGSQSEHSAGGSLAIRWLFPATPGPITRLALPSTIGRGEECGTRLESQQVSRCHAEVVLTGPVPVIRDRDSRNGTHVNGRRVQEAPLSPKDVVRIGEGVGVVCFVPMPDPGFGMLAEGLVGGPVLAAALQIAERAARSNLPVLIVGETGTGKEAAARAVHTWSGRGGAFVPVNCATLPETLAESSLFGHRRGAFTGADRASGGHFRAADRGTLLLDEVTDLPLAVQPKLLRALESGKIVPIGESVALPVDVRVVAAAQESMLDAVNDGRFRGDLFARLDGVTVTLPPLRERIEEVPYLFAHLLVAEAGGSPPSVEPQLVEQLCRYDWPFNVRELVHLVRRLLVVHGDERTLRRRHLPESLLAASADEPEVERDNRELNALVAALRARRGNVKEAAADVRTEAREVGLTGATVTVGVGPIANDGPNVPTPEPLNSLSVFGTERSPAKHVLGIAGRMSALFRR